MLCAIRVAIIFLYLSLLAKAFYIKYNPTKFWSFLGFHFLISDIRLWTIEKDKCKMEVFFKLLQQRLNCSKQSYLHG